MRSAIEFPGVSFKFFLIGIFYFPHHRRRENRENKFLMEEAGPFWVAIRRSPAGTSCRNETEQKEIIKKREIDRGKRR